MERAVDLQKDNMLNSKVKRTNNVSGTAMFEKTE
jgi:hypothetical protein